MLKHFSSFLKLFYSNVIFSILISFSIFSLVLFFKTFLGPLLPIRPLYANYFHFRHFCAIFLAHICKFLPIPSFFVILDLSILYFWPFLLPFFVPFYAHFIPFPFLFFFRFYPFWPILDAFFNQLCVHFWPIFANYVLIWGISPFMFIAIYTSSTLLSHCFLFFQIFLFFAFFGSLYKFFFSFFLVPLPIFSTFFSTAHSYNLSKCSPFLAILWSFFSQFLQKLLHFSVSFFVSIVNIDLFSRFFLANPPFSWLSRVLTTLLSRFLTWFSCVFADYDLGLYPLSEPLFSGTIVSKLPLARCRKGPFSPQGLRKLG